MGLIQWRFKANVNFYHLPFFTEYRLSGCRINGIAIDLRGAAVSEGDRDRGSICDMVNDRHLTISEA